MMYMPDANRATLELIEAPAERLRSGVVEPGRHQLYAGSARGGH